MSRYFRIHFCFPIVHPTAPTSLQIQANIKEHLSLSILRLKCILNFFCRSCRGRRAYCRDTKRVHVVPRHVLVSYMYKCTKYHGKNKYAPQSIISLCGIFLDTLCSISAFTIKVTHTSSFSSCFFLSQA